MTITRSPSRPVSGSPAYSPGDLPVYRGGQGGSAPAPAVTLLYDSFTEASTTSIVSHTPDTLVSPASGPWQQNGTFYQVGSAGVLEVAAGTTVRFCWLNSGISDGIYSLEQVVRGGGLVFRHTDANNSWIALNSSDDTTVKLNERTAQTFTLRGSYDTGVSSEHKIQAICNGTSITIYIDGVSRISHTSSVRVAETNSGAYSNTALANGYKVADDFRVIDSTDAGDLP